MMKLQGAVSRVYKGKEYLKYWVTVPIKIVRRKQWVKGKKLKISMVEGRVEING